MIRLAGLLSLGLLLAAVSASAQAPAPAAPMVRIEGLRPVSAHVQVIPDNSTPLVPNVGFVVGATGVLVIDTGLGPANGAAVAAVMQDLAKGKATYLVATHAHPEHDLGAQAFPAQTRMIRSRDQQADVADQGMKLAQVFASRSPAIAELLKDARSRPADISFDRDLTLDLGGVSVRLIALGPNHTAGDTAIWVADDRVLFSGDVAMKAQPAIATPQASLDHWFGSLDRLEGLRPLVVVPSHGPVGDAGFIRRYRDYLAEVQKRTRDAKAAGLDQDAAVARVTEAMVGAYPDRGRLAGAIRMAYVE